MVMGIIIKGSISTECLRGSASIVGKMAVPIRVILSRDKGVVMEFGWRIRTDLRDIEVTTQTIRRQVMEYILGTMVGNTKVILRMTIVMAMVNSMTPRVSCSTKDSGRTESNQIKK